MTAVHVSCAEPSKAARRSPLNVCAAAPVTQEGERPSRRRLLAAAAVGHAENLWPVLLPTSSRLGCVFNLHLFSIKMSSLLYL
jgi:hypothetical protein